MNKNYLSFAYFSFFLICMILTNWYEIAFMVFIAVSCVIGVIVFLYDDHQKDKRLRELEEKLNAKGDLGVQK